MKCLFLEVSMQHLQITTDYSKKKKKKEKKEIPDKEEGTIALEK